MLGMNIYIRHKSPYIYVDIYILGRGPCIRIAMSWTGFGYPVVALCLAMGVYPLKINIFVACMLPCLYIAGVNVGHRGGRLRVYIIYICMARPEIYVVRIRIYAHSLQR